MQTIGIVLMQPTRRRPINGVPGRLTSSRNSLKNEAQRPKDGAARFPAAPRRKDSCHCSSTIPERKLPAFEKTRGLHGWQIDQERASVPGTQTRGHVENSRGEDFECRQIGKPQRGQEGRQKIGRFPQPPVRLLARRRQLMIAPKRSPADAEPGHKAGLSGITSYSSSTTCSVPFDRALRAIKDVTHKTLGITEPRN